MVAEIGNSFMMDETQSQRHCWVQGQAEAEVRDGAVHYGQRKASAKAWEYGNMAWFGNHSNQSFLWASVRQKSPQIYFQKSVIFYLFQSLLFYEVIPCLFYHFILLKYS